MSTPPRTYRKHNSFIGIRHAAAPGPVLERIAHLYAELDQRCDSPYQREIVERACRDLLNDPAGVPIEGDSHAFELHTNVSDEMQRLTEVELPRYLFYRYRYEVFPQQQVLDDFPPCLQIEPTSICNYRCTFCFQTDTDFTGKAGGMMGLMPLELFQRAVDQAAGRCEALTLASRGEPLMNKNIETMLAYAAGKFLALKINTNAWFLDESKCHAILQAGVNTLVFSADAIAEPSYSLLRVNGKLERVLDNIRRFQRIRAQHYPHARTITRVSGVQVPGTASLDEMEAFWREHVDQVALVAYNPWENIYVQPENGITAACTDLWRRMFVWWDGAVNPCDADYKSTLTVGNCKQDTLGDLWRSDAYQRLRDTHREGRRGACSPCKGCAVV